MSKKVTEKEKQNLLGLFGILSEEEKRSLIKVNITDAVLAEKRVSVLMGDSVEPRKEWIEENVEFSLEDDYKIKKKYNKLTNFIFLRIFYNKKHSK